MAAPWQFATDALQQRDDWVALNLDMAQAAYSQGTGAKVPWTTFFANAVHTITDATSPAHIQNGIPITWPSWPNVLEHGDEPSSIEKWGNMSPQLMRQNIGAIQKAWLSMVGRQCGCGK